MCTWDRPVNVVYLGYFHLPSLFPTSLVFHPTLPLGGKYLNLELEAPCSHSASTYHLVAL